MSDLPSRDVRIADILADPDLVTDIVADYVDGRYVDRETIDREAAARQLAEALQWWGTRPSDSTFQIDEWADTIVDAALGEI